MLKEQHFIIECQQRYMFSTAHQQQSPTRVNHLTNDNCDFLGMISSMYCSSFGNVSTIFVRMARWTLLLMFCRPATSSLALNLLNISTSCLNRRNYNSPSTSVFVDCRFTI